MQHSASKGKSPQQGPASAGRWHPGAQFVLINGVPIARIAGGEDDPPKDPPADGDPPAADPKQTGTGDEFDKDRALATIKRQRQTEKDLKAKIRELEAATTQQHDQDTKDQGDVAKLQEQLRAANANLEKAQKAAQDTLIRLEVERQARKLGFLDEDDAYRLIDRDDIDFSDDGKPENLADLVKDLAKAKPHLVKASDATKTEGDGTGEAGNGEQKPAAGKSPNPTPQPEQKPAAVSDEEKAKLEREKRDFYSAAI